MRKLTNTDISKLEVGSRLFDIVGGKWEKVTRINGSWVEVGMMLEDKNSLKKNYRI